jgi:hypothetical protein
MIGIGGFADFWNYFIKKFLFILLTRKFDKLFRFKYLLQVTGVPLLIYYFMKELRISANPYNENVLMKLLLLFSYSLTNFAGSLILPATNHRANLRLELLIYNALLLSYLLAYPTAYVTVLCLLYLWTLSVSIGV